MTTKSSTALFLLSLLINYKSIACASFNGEKILYPSPSSVAFVDDAPKFTGKRPCHRLWDLVGEIKKLRAEENLCAPFEYAKSEFYDALEEEDWETAKRIREENFFRMETASIATLEHFYQSMPELFLSSEAANPFLQASQEQVDYFIEHYSYDFKLMENIFKAACLNSSIQLPDDFFSTFDSRAALRFIQLVNEIAPENFELMRKCYELPESLHHHKLPNGETVLTDALKRNSIIAISSILHRPDAAKFVNLKNARMELPIRIFSRFVYDLKLKEKLLRKFFAVAEGSFENGNDAELLKVLDGYIEGSHGNGYLLDKLSGFIAELKNKTRNDEFLVKQLEIRL